MVALVVPGVWGVADEEAVAVEMKMPFPKMKSPAAKPVGNRGECLPHAAGSAPGHRRRCRRLYARLLHVSWIEGLLWAAIAPVPLVLLRRARWTGCLICRCACASFSLFGDVLIFGF